MNSLKWNGSQTSIRTKVIRIHIAKEERKHCMNNGAYHFYYGDKKRAPKHMGSLAECATKKRIMK